MKLLIRWARFNLVGVIGMVVQLIVLAFFNRIAAGRYLYTSAAAVEVALLHNFLWHLRYTWRDRSNGSLLGRLVRFQLSNGAVSVVGNLLVMWILVHGAKVPVLAANLVAILFCSVINFFLGDRWVFPAARKAESGSSSVWALGCDYQKIDGSYLDSK